MPIRSHTLKQQAKEALRAATVSPILVTLVYLMLTTFLVEGIHIVLPNSDLFSMGFLSLFLSILLTFYQLVMKFGYSCWALETARGEERGLWSLLDGFGMVGKVLLTQVRISLGIMVRGMLLCFSYFILVVALSAIGSPVLSLLLTVFVSISFYVCLIQLILRYSLASFVLYDNPQAGSMIAVHRSLELMSGRIWSLCKLYLSFWPWYLAQAIVILAVFWMMLRPEFAQLSALYAADHLEELLRTIESLVYTTAASPVLSLCVVPIQLILQPYQTAALANFYRSISPDPVASA